MKVKINKPMEDSKVMFHLVRVDSVLTHCPKCDGEVFKPKVEKQDHFIEYKTCCVKCEYCQVDGTYVSTINECGEACKVK